jgi:hypothetical protein
MRRGTVLLVVASLALLVPAAAQATGPASFVRATGGPLTVPVHPSGVTIYPTSPAYVVLRYRPATAAMERYASTHAFPWVAIRDTRSGRTGMDCFADAHLPILPFFISDFKEGSVEYHGLFLQYSSWYFRPGDFKVADCGLHHAVGPVVPTVSLRSSAVNLHVDCLVRTCRGNLVAFRRPNVCANPSTVLPGRLGCFPVFTARFLLPGGRSTTFRIPISGSPAASRTLGLTVNGKLRVLSKLTSLPHTQALPARPRRSSVSVGCSGGIVSSAVSASGTVKPGGPPATVAVTFSGPSGPPVTVTGRTATPGKYTVRFSPLLGGNWTARAEFIGDRGRKAAVSGLCHFAVAKHPSTMTVACPAQATVGMPANITGTLDATSVPVTLDYTPPTAPAFSHKATTTSAGGFSDTITPALNQTGTWSVRASWPGDASHSSASATCTFSAS